MFPFYNGSLPLWISTEKTLKCPINQRFFWNKQRECDDLFPIMAICDHPAAAIRTCGFSRNRHNIDTNLFGVSRSCCQRADLRLAEIIEKKTSMVKPDFPYEVAIPDGKLIGGGFFIRWYQSRKLLPLKIIITLS
jgi:hypothetical protein